MKNFFRDSNGFWHEVVPFLVIAVIAFVGVHVLVSSDAATQVSLSTGRFVARAGTSTSTTASSSTASATAHILTVGNPAASIAPNPDFMNDGACARSAHDNTVGCNNNALAAINNGRSALEARGPVSLNMTAYDAMTVPEQIFVVTNLERISRGLAPAVALTNQLQALATIGANNDADPGFPAGTLSGGGRISSGGSNEALGTTNPLGSDYFWMYDDGYGGVNPECNTPSASSCWAHRDNILNTYTTTGCPSVNVYMGTGWNQHNNSYADVLVGDCGAAPNDQVFTWAQAQKLLTPQSTPAYGVAFQANSGSLWTALGAGTQSQNLSLGMASHTSASTAAVNGGFETAFQANTGSLWMTGSAGGKNWSLGMAAGTSPSIAAVNGGYEIAFQANTGSLWTVGTAGSKNWGLGMAAGTSPSITGLSGGGYEVAFQANTGSLYTAGTAGSRSWSLGMDAGTSPSITAVSGGYEIAFQANTGSLYTAGTAGSRSWSLGMDAGTSPSITSVFGAYVMAFQANNGNLYTVGNTVATKNWKLGMARGTSPAVTVVPGGYEVAFQANTGSLYTVGNAGNTNWSLGMASGTSPSIAY
jgi:hypothetical protein